MMGSVAVNTWLCSANSCSALSFNLITVSSTLLLLALAPAMLEVWSSLQEVFVEPGMLLVCRSLHDVLLPGSGPTVTQRFTFIGSR